MAAVAAARVAAARVAAETAAETAAAETVVAETVVAVMVAEGTVAETAAAETVVAVMVAEGTVAAKVVALVTPQSAAVLPCGFVYPTSPLQLHLQDTTIWEPRYSMRPRGCCPTPSKLARAQDLL